MHLDTFSSRVTVADYKFQRLRRLARRVTTFAHYNQQMVPLRFLMHFCGVCASLNLAYPLARFHTRSLYFNMVEAERSSRKE